tara:strand:+ start:2147 stop:3562 length:1416 start_codon:yes stop_codon:yes gene_type:complete
MTMTVDANKNMYQFVSDDAEILSLEKAAKRPLETGDIQKALDEYQKLFKAGISSPGELLTLVRAFPNDKGFTKAAKDMGLFDDGYEPMIVGGPASVELVDREGHLITTKALSKAFDLYMKNFRTRNAMVLHSDVQVGWALPAYITKAGNIYKSGVDPDGLFFITELRGDTRIAKRVMEQITEGKLKSYSIAGSATKTQNIQKGMESYMQVDDMELAEVTVCEKGVNQGANFDILKGDSGKPTSSCIDGSCLMKSEHTHNPTTVLVKENGKVDFLASFLNLVKEKSPFNKTTGKDDLSMFSEEAYRMREQVHHRLLDDQGFPAEIEPEWNRYIPVSETEVGEDGRTVRPMPPWVVNEAGQDLGTRWTDQALSPPKGKPDDKPYNLQKFLGLTGQRKKALIIEGHDSATDAFLAKDHLQTRMDKDQRQSHVHALSRRNRKVTSGQPSLIPLLIDLLRATKTKPVKKSDDCGCD